MRNKYFFSDAVVMTRGSNGMYTNLTDFRFGNTTEHIFQTTSKYLIVLYESKNAVRNECYFAEISLSDLLRLASIKEDTVFISSIKNKMGENDDELFEDILAILASRKISNTVEGYIEKVSNDNYFSFRKRKVIKNKEIFPVLFEAKFIK